MQGGSYDQGFHEIHQISPWNPVDFTQISPVKSTQNYKSKCFSKNSSVWWMQGGGFHPEIWLISPRFHLWNPPKIIKASVSAKTLQFDECRVGAMTKDFKIMSFCVMIKYRSFVFRKTNQSVYNAQNCLMVCLGILYKYAGIVCNVEASVYIGHRDTLTGRLGGGECWLVYTSSYQTCGCMDLLATIVLQVMHVKTPYKYIVGSTFTNTGRRFLC